ncbi:MAG: VapC toxin family PIN domain ribonuclease, partial [Micromonosporaceae bacterium]
MAGDIYLADTSVYVLQGRHPEVRRRFEALLSEGRLAGCQLTALEYLNNAPDPKGYEILWEALHGHRWIDVTTAALDRALDVHRML